MLWAQPLTGSLPAQVLQAEGCTVIPWDVRLSGPLGIGRAGLTAVSLTRGAQGLGDQPEILAPAVVWFHCGRSNAPAATPAGTKHIGPTGDMGGASPVHLLSSLYF